MSCDKLKTTYTVMLLLIAIFYSITHSDIVVFHTTDDLNPVTSDQFIIDNEEWQQYTIDFSKYAGSITFIRKISGIIVIIKNLFVF